MVKSHEDADDVLQNTFLKIYQNISKFKGNSKLYSWMYRIATNEALTFINKRAKHLNCTTTEAQELAINNLKSDTYFDGDAAQIKLQQAINTLPKKQQIVFNMKYFENLKFKEIAEIVETSEGALKASYHIAVKKIKRYLNEN